MWRALSVKWGYWLILPPKLHSWKQWWWIGGPVHPCVLGVSTKGSRVPSCPRWTGRVENTQPNSHHRGSSANRLLKRLLEKEMEKEDGWELGLGGRIIRDSLLSKEGISSGLVRSYSVQLQSRVRLVCDPMTGLPILHYLLKFAETHVHWVDDATVLCYLVAKSCPILLQPHGLPGSSVHGVSQARILGWVLLQGIFATQGSNLWRLCLLCWQADALPLSHLGSLLYVGQC